MCVFVFKGRLNVYNIEMAYALTNFYLTLKSFGERGVGGNRNSFYRNIPRILFAAALIYHSKTTISNLAYYLVLI